MVVNQAKMAMRNARNANTMAYTLPQCRMPGVVSDAGAEEFAAVAAVAATRDCGSRTGPAETRACSGFDSRARGCELDTGLGTGMDPEAEGPESGVRPGRGTELEPSECDSDASGGMRSPAISAACILGEKIDEQTVRSGNTGRQLSEE